MSTRVGWLAKALLLTVFSGLLLAPSASPVGAEPRQSSADYDDLVALFHEFRASQDATNSDGVPDYTAAGIEDRYQGLQQLHERLATFEIDEWPVWQQVDYHLVRAEMNALEFHHRVHKPWARDPGFYSIRGGDAGASIDAETFTRPLFELRPPFTEDEKAQYQARLRAIPGMYEQARENLTEAAGDFADLAIRNAEGEARIYDRIADRLREDHPDLVADALAAGEAVRDYRAWLEANRHEMTAPAGIGKDNYTWWLRNVQLAPWGWEEADNIIQREYDRIITFLKLEEHRNRDLPPLEVAMTEREFEASLYHALNYVVEFLRDREIMTIDDWVNPADYTGFASLEELDERLAREAAESPESRDSEARFLPENTSIDTKVRQREILPGETHEYIGHMLDRQRQERLALSPIRSARRRYNMGSRRTEGWAMGLEELLMQAGVLDDRPRKGREMEYLMNASHMSLAVPDMKMHANEINLEEARHLCAEIMPRGWSRPDERMVWFEMQSNIRNPGGFHSNVVTGKAYFMKLFRERAQALGDDFVLRNFIDEFLASGIIPMSLIRWEMTGNSDDITLVTEDLPADNKLDRVLPLAGTPKTRSGMVLIPGGSFMMGYADGQDLEKPVHEVELDAFYMDTHEVTLEEFGQFVDATAYVTDPEKNDGSIIWNGESWEKTEGIDWRFDAAGNPHTAEETNQPVTHLSWNDANAYCQWGDKRLPTEAEWEYAARGGERGFKFAWGDEPLGKDVVANVSDENFVKVVTTWPHTEGYDDGYTFGAPVGSFPPNSFGLYDMSGNAWEWCADYFDPEYYSRSPKENPRNDDPDERRVMRGNSWDGRPGLMRASRRTSDLQSNSYADTGFRCAKDIE